MLKWNLDLTKCQGTWEIVLLYQGFIISRFCSIHFKRPGWRISFFILRTLLHRGLSNRGSTVRNFSPKYQLLFCPISTALKDEPTCSSNRQTEAAGVRHTKTCKHATRAKCGKTYNTVFIIGPKCGKTCTNKVQCSNYKNLFSLEH